MAVIQTIKEQAYDIMLKKILSQEYPMGHRINIVQLSNELGISNSPIREALNLLEQQGLVTTTRNSGIHVVTLTPKDQFELSQMLFFWMDGAYRYCCKWGGIPDLCKEMESVLKAQEKYFAQKNSYKFTHYANMFDRCIIAATKNHRLIAQYDKTFPLIFLGSIYEQKERDYTGQIGLQQHKKILEAIRQDNREQVAALLEEHYFKPTWDLREQGAD